MTVAETTYPEVKKRMNPYVKSRGPGVNVVAIHFHLHCRLAIYRAAQHPPRPLPYYNHRWSKIFILNYTDRLQLRPLVWLRLVFHVIN